MSVCVLLAIAQLASGLNLELEKEGTNYAYVTMWLDKAKVPARVMDHVLTKAETVSLNSAGITEQGLPNLAPRKVATKLGFRELNFQEENGKPKQKLQEKQKMPLRPRNSNFNGVLDIAKNLRDVGAKYPLVVLTNSDDLKDPSILAENPNLKFVWLNETDFLERKCKIGAGHQLHFQKLAIWKMTQYDKLLWLDTDLGFSNNVDYVFKEDLKRGLKIMGQIDDYHCDNRVWSPTSGGICSGMLLLKPNLAHFEGLMQQQSKMQACWGDQAIISSYFTGGMRSANQFKRETINFARCKEMGNMDVWHFSGSPDAKRVGDPEGFKRTSTGQLVNKTEVKLKAHEAAQKKKAEKAKQEKR